MGVIKKVVYGAASLSVLIIYSLSVRSEQSKVDSTVSRSKNTHLASNNISSTDSPRYGTLKNGNYTGNVVDAYYGNVQVAAVISGGKLTDIEFLQTPNGEQESIFINQQAKPRLKQEAIKSQSPNVNTISGATFTTQAFKESLTSALSQANV
ncbi:MAG: FMN-binding protein [Candidatus Saccharimonadales bacterium]